MKFPDTCYLLWQITSTISLRLPQPFQSRLSPKASRIWMKLEALNQSVSNFPQHHIIPVVERMDLFLSLLRLWLISQMLTLYYYIHSSSNILYCLCFTLYLFAHHLTECICIFDSKCFSQNLKQRKPKSSNVKIDGNVLCKPWINPFSIFTP